MGEIADMMIEGLLDSETGEVIDGDAPGYPRSRNWRKPKPGRNLEKDVRCPVCGKLCRGMSGVRAHAELKHPGISLKGKQWQDPKKDTPCPQCKRMFRGETGLADHMRVKHGVA